jgi:hypothetical protein
MMGINWITGIYKAFVYSAAILFAAYLFTQGAASLGALLTSLFLLLAGLFMLLVITVYVIQGVTQVAATAIAMATIKQAAPILIIMGFVGYLLWLVFKYKGVIESGHVAPSYNTFMNISVALILAQMGLLMRNQSPSGAVTMSGVTSGVVYLIDFVLFICVNIIHTTLRYFTTDGFGNQYRAYARRVFLHQ